MLTKMTKRGIAYEELGSGLPFVALHGNSLDRRMSIGAFEPLLEGSPYRRIYPDLPCMGESFDLGSEESSSDGMLAALMGFLREAVPEGPFLLAGESYGGYLARGIALELGGRVAGLFLLCPAIVSRRADRSLPEAIALEEEPGWRDAAIAGGASADDIAVYESCAVVRNKANFDRTMAEVISGIRIARLDALAKVHSAPGFSFDHLGGLGANGGETSGNAPFDALFEGPACFVLGRQDSSVGWRDALRLASRYPRASYHIVDGTGHNLQVEKPDIFASAFREWLRACGERARL